MLIYKKCLKVYQICLLEVRLRLKLSKAVAPADAVADASAEEVMKLVIRLHLCKVVVVDADASRANLAAALESTLADTAGELLVRYGR